jgi:hypothetical protein
MPGRLGEFQGEPLRKRHREGAVMEATEVSEKLHLVAEAQAADGAGNLASGMS